VSLLEGNLCINNLSCEFLNHEDKKTIAIENVGFTVKPGEFVSIVGPSGCGKSTMLRMIAGLQKPSSGEIKLDGKIVDKPGYERGLVFQDPTLFPWLTVYDNVASGLVAWKVFKEQKELVSYYIKLVGLEGFEKAYPHHLSGGMAQRVAIARALVNDPKVLLLDEPLGALDAFTRMYMQDEILRIWGKRKNTLLLVTHDVEEAVYLSDRIIVMSPRPGRIRKIVEVNIKRPRDRNNKEFLSLKNDILTLLNFVK
jgi:ABC-type nitrate/sulfonate/bicarbonate transport system ATPase subunit